MASAYIGTTFMPPLFGLMASRIDHADFCRTYYLAHKDAALELQCLRRSFLSSILFPAFCRLPANRREQLSQYLSKVRRWDFRAFIDFFCIVLDSLGNPLLPSLFAESTMFGHLSDLYMMTDASYSDFYFDRLANYMENLLTSHAAEDFDGIDPESPHCMPAYPDNQMLPGCPGRYPPGSLSPPARIPSAGIIPYHLPPAVSSQRVLLSAFYS